MNNRVKAYKAFNQDMTCRGFQYEVGKTYKHEGDASLCKTGFHACLHPLAVLNYYPVTSRFAVVELNGVSPETDEYTKVCGAEITIQAEVQISDLVDAAVKHVFDAAQWIKGSAATGDRGAAHATGYRGAASATGDNGAASATGHSGAAFATGNGGVASATGDNSAASATGHSGAAMASGYKGRAMGAEGCAIFLCERDDATGEFLHVWAGIAGQDGIKPMTWYFLKNGHPMEVEE